ncbi:MAG: M48 family metalloprotease [Alphaproteobacteria bacterium]|jgi:predicted Zn-dependent protease|nr:M48 family metalloprotease [Alphaproteobacteria bacterium]
MKLPAGIKNTRAKSTLSAFALLLTACSVNPATGERDFTAFMSPQEELRVGQQEHPKIIQQFGGVYDDPEVTAYVNRIGQNLAKVSELPDLNFTFTVLDDDIVNAFALPGGYVYISRGLLGLANTEAELAGVLGHEIGHVTARHSAQRYSSSVVAQGLSVGAGILGSIFLGTPDIGQAVGQGSALYLQSFSREHEFEADTLGVRYLARAGYATDAMASFLASLQAYSSLEAKVSGRPDPAERRNIMSTHPRTQDRVVAATRAANVQSVPNPEIGNRNYMKAIDGITFGGSEKAGLVRGRIFVHEPLNFLFEVPQDFHLTNGSQQVVAQGPNNTVIIFSGGNAPAGSRMDAYLTQVWAKNTRFTKVETIQINGMEAATGRTVVNNRSGRFDAQLVAIRHSPNQVYRFVFLTPTNQTVGLQTELRATMESFRKLTRTDRNRYGPWTVDTKVTGRRDTVKSLSRNMPMPGPREEWFRVLNGLKPGSEPFPGQVVKVIVN